MPTTFARVVQLGAAEFSFPSYFPNRISMIEQHQRANNLRSCRPAERSGNLISFILPTEFQCSSSINAPTTLAHVAQLGAAELLFPSYFKLNVDDLATSACKQLVFLSPDWESRISHFLSISDRISMI